MFPILCKNFFLTLRTISSVSIFSRFMKEIRTGGANNVLGYRFSPPLDVFSDVEHNPNNMCFCPSGPPCAPHGLFNVSLCQYGQYTNPNQQLGVVKELWTVCRDWQMLMNVNKVIYSFVVLPRTKAYPFCNNYFKLLFQNLQLVFVVMTKLFIFLNIVSSNFKVRVPNIAGQFKTRAFQVENNPPHAILLHLHSFCWMLRFLLQLFSEQNIFKCEIFFHIQEKFQTPMQVLLVE